MGTIAFNLKITDEMILDAKRQVIKEQIEKYNEQFSDKTGDLKNSLSYIEKDGKFYIFKGVEKVCAV